MPSYVGASHWLVRRIRGAYASILIRRPTGFDFGADMNRKDNPYAT